MTSAVRSILRKFNRDTQCLNIILLGLPHHEKFCHLLALTEHNFYLWTEQFRPWSYSFLAKPSNFFHLPTSQEKFDNSIDFDLLICNNRLATLDLALNISHGWHIPCICVHHESFGTLVLDNGLQGNIQKHKIAQFLSRQAHLNIFNSLEIANSWQCLGKIIAVGIDTNFFSPVQLEKPYKLLWQPTPDNNLNNFVVQQLSQKIQLVQVQPSMNLEMLRGQYQNAHFYLNLNGISTDVGLMEAGSCGLPIIGVKNPFYDIALGLDHISQLPNLVTFINNLSFDKYKEEQIKQRERILLLNNDNFVEDWKNILQRTANLTYIR